MRKGKYYNPFHLKTADKGKEKVKVKKNTHNTRKVPEVISSLPSLKTEEKYQVDERGQCKRE